MPIKALPGLQKSCILFWQLIYKLITRKANRNYSAAGVSSAASGVASVAVSSTAAWTSSTASSAVSTTASSSVTSGSGTGFGFGFTYHKILSFLRIDNQFFDEKRIKNIDFMTYENVPYSDHYPIKGWYLMKWKWGEFEKRFGIQSVFSLIF